MKNFVEISKPEIEEKTVCLQDLGVFIERAHLGQIYSYTVSKHDKKLFSLSAIYRSDSKSIYNEIFFSLTRADGNFCVFSEHDKDYAAIFKLYQSLKQAYAKQQEDIKAWSEHSIIFRIGAFFKKFSRTK